MDKDLSFLGRDVQNIVPFLKAELPKYVPFHPISKRILEAAIAAAPGLARILLQEQHTRAPSPTFGIGDQPPAPSPDFNTVHPVREKTLSQYPGSRQLAVALPVRIGTIAQTPQSIETRLGKTWPVSGKAASPLPWQSRSEWRAPCLLQLPSTSQKPATPEACSGA